MDGIDAALVKFQDDKPELVDYLQLPIGETLRKELKAINKFSSIEQINLLDVQLGEQFAESALSLLKKNKLTRDKIAAIGCHGQTVLHRPEKPFPGSLQIGDGNTITCRTGIMTVTDFRRMDMAAGGQGAPLAPVFHNQVFRGKGINRIILNIGGMANITLLPPSESEQPVYGFDTGPGNVLMDDWINAQSGKSFDKDGQWAASGTIDKQLLDYLLDDDFLRLAPPKSTGRDYFNNEWLESKLSAFNKPLSPADVQSTLAELTVVSITGAIADTGFKPDELIVCGGGAHNLFLLQRLAGNLNSIKVMTTEAFGISPDAVEAVTFAWLAKRRLENKPGNLPEVTGAESEQILGALYTPLVQ